MKLLHTADWQLGLRLNFVGGDAAVRLRAQRFDTVRRIGELAQQHRVDVVVVAGDVFDDNGVGRDTLQQARDALERFGGVPVVLLPGNHDPATPDAALRRLADLRSNIHLGLERQSLHFPGVTIYPCPLTSRHHYDDPAGWLPARDAEDGIRVAVAHGGALAFEESTETPNRIDVDEILRRGFDYVALGDWHGTYRVNDRAWYPGAPEPTRFKEKLPGNVLLVDIDGPGALPRIEAVPIARTRWISDQRQLGSDADLDDFEAWLEALPEKSWTLVNLVLEGQLSLMGRHRLDLLVGDFSERLALLRIDTDACTAAPTEADLTAMQGEGFLGRAIEALRTSDEAVDADALRLLYRLTQASS